MLRQLRSLLAVGAVAAFCGAGLADAQTPAAPPADIERMTFEEAVARAIERNTDVAQAAQAILRAEALLQQARVVRKPIIGASFDLTVLDAARGFQGNITQPQTQSLTAGSLSYPILAAAQWAAANQARDQVNVARLSAADVRRQIATATGQAYLSVIAEQRQVAVNLVAIENAKAHVDYATARLDAGAGSKLNELRASQELATDTVLLEASRLALRRAQEALGVLLTADMPIDAAAEPAFEVPPPPGDDAWMAIRTDTQLFSAALTAAERVVRDSWKDWIPTVSGAFRPQLLYPSGLFQPARTWQAVISADIPIFDGGLRRAARRLREVSRNTTQLQLDDVRLRARAELRTAQAAAEISERGVTSARLAAQNAADVVRITDVAFRAGATTNLEVIDAQRTAREADTAAAQAEDQVRRARLDLLVALGQFPR